MRAFETKAAWMTAIALLLAIGLGVAIWLMPRSRNYARELAPATVPSTQKANVLRIGLIPERDIFEQRRRYKVLADYLSKRLDRPVELVSLSTYQSVLQDFADKEVDAAFLGSLVAALVMDRYAAEPLAKPVLVGNVSTYKGVIFVPESSPVRSLEDLRGRSIAMLRATTAADLFPNSEFAAAGMLDGESTPRIVWVGTHDQVVNEVMNGRVEAGAVKDLVLDDLLRIHPKWRVRRIKEGESMPNNALVARADLDPALRGQLGELLLGMHQTPGGQAALEAFGALRFEPCAPADYHAIYDRVERMGPAWAKMGVTGAAPRRPRNRE